MKEVKDLINNTYPKHTNNSDWVFKLGEEIEKLVAGRCAFIASVIEGIDGTAFAVQEAIYNEFNLKSTDIYH